MPALPPFVLSLALAFAGQSPSPPLPRLIVSLREASAANFTVKVENARDQPLVLGARTYLVLSREGPRPDAPTYWAEIAMSKLPTPSAPMRLAARQAVDVPLDLRSLSWSPDRLGGGPGHTLARAVPPGEYELQVRIVDERGAWWTSGEIAIKVSRGGGVGKP
jgi:hypothetical protein